MVFERMHFIYVNYWTDLHIEITTFANHRKKKKLILNQWAAANKGSRPPRKTKQHGLRKEKEAVQD